MRLVLFDIDLTLIDPAGAGRHSMELAFAELFPIADAFRSVSFAGFTDRSILRQALLAHDLLDGESAVRCGGEAIDFQEFVSCFAARYAHHLAQVLPTRPGRVLPGVRRLLDYLHRQPGTMLGLATGNFECGARLKLDHYSLWEWFAGGGFGDRHLDRAGVVAEALERLDGACADHPDPGTAGDSAPGLAARRRQWSRILVVGDTPYDIAGGKSVGAVTVGVATGLHNAEELRAAGADLVYNDFADAERTACELAEA